MTFRVSEVRFAPAPEHLRPTGVVGWSSFTLDGCLRLEGVAVRRSTQGRTYLSYPMRDDGWGKRWQYMRPLDGETGRDIERQVLEQLGEVVS